MIPVTKVNEIGHGFCPFHDHGDVTVTFNVGSSDVLVENIQVGLVSSLIGHASCGHTSIANTGSSSVFVNGQAIHRVSDMGILDSGGTYTTSTGSSSVFIG